MSLSAQTVSESMANGDTVKIRVELRGRIRVRLYLDKRF